MNSVHIQLTEQNKPEQKGHEHDCLVLNALLIASPVPTDISIIDSADKDLLSFQLNVSKSKLQELQTEDAYSQQVSQLSQKKKMKMMTFFLNANNIKKRSRCIYIISNCDSPSCPHEVHLEQKTKMSLDKMLPFAYTNF